MGLNFKKAVEQSMNLNLPPDVARQRQMEVAKNNQLYSLAFEIYKQLVTSSLYAQYATEELVDLSIEKARVFTQIVAERIHDRANNQSS